MLKLLKYNYGDKVTFECLDFFSLFAGENLLSSHELNWRLTFYQAFYFKASKKKYTELSTDHWGRKTKDAFLLFALHSNGQNRAIVFLTSRLTYAYRPSTKQLREVAVWYRPIYTLLALCLATQNQNTSQQGENTPHFNN